MTVTNEMSTKFMRLHTRYNDLINTMLYSRALTTKEEAELLALEEAIEALCEVAAEDAP